MTKQLPAIIDRTEIIGADHARTVPALIAAVGDRASTSLSGILRGEHPQSAHAPGLQPRVADFLMWCDDNLVPSIMAVQPLYVAAWTEQQTRTHTAPTVKLRLAVLPPWAVDPMSHRAETPASGQEVFQQPAKPVGQTTDTHTRPATKRAPLQFRTPRLAMAGPG